MSILLSTPALLWLLWPRRKTHLRGAIWLTVIAITIPILLYQNTGWEQFGYRFILDVLPYLVIALALGGRALTRPLKSLILVGVVVNVIGAATFQRAGTGKLYGHFMTEEPKK